MPRNGTYDPATGETYFRGHWYDSEDLEQAQQDYETAMEDKWEAERDEHLMEEDHA